MLFHYNTSTAGPHRGAAPPAAPLRGPGGAQGGHAAGAGAGGLSSTGAARSGRSGGKMRGNIAKSREKLIKLGDFACFSMDF